MQLKGPFANQSSIEAKYTGEGKDTSPRLTWTQSPAGTKSFALICDDPDAPSAKKPGPEPWVHWVIYNIPANVTELPDGVERKPQPAQVPNARQGKNSWPSDNVGYRGPMPPPGSGPHRYFFKLYALDCELKTPPGEATKATILSAMRDHVLADTQLVGTYERK